MAEQTAQEQKTVSTTAPNPQERPQQRRGRGAPRSGGRREGESRDRRTPRRDAPRPEFDQKIINIRRVARVMAGGRRFSFSVAVVAGDRRGRVGVGVGKAGDTALAIDKALQQAKKNMVKVPLTKENRLPHDVAAKYSASEIVLMPAAGRGLVAGSSVRTVLELAGITDVTAKILSRSKNKLNNARATIKAFSQLKK